MKKVALIGGAHALLTLAVGLWLCLRKSSSLGIAQWAAYVAGAEVLWRMCKAPIPWEFAKYSIWLVCLITFVRSRDFRGSWYPAVYLALLLPASAVTFEALPFDLARSEVSFALSGPLCLAVCGLLFSTLSLSVSGFYRVGLMLLAPIAGAASVVLSGLAAGDMSFDNASNSATSGGYGPNQVSAMLSLGAVVAVLLCLRERLSNFVKAGFAVLAVWMLAQATLTFSRTGVYLFVAAFGIAALFLLRAKGQRLRFLIAVGVLGVIAAVGFHMLDSFTEGKLSERFNDRGLTGRDSIAKLDLQVWKENPILGAGAGMSMFERAALGDEHAAHTEYTRLLADHGLLGAVALIVLFVMTGLALWHTRGNSGKAIAFALAVWAFLFMTVSGMRLAAPAFLLGLVQARFVDGTPHTTQAERSLRRTRRRSVAGQYSVSGRGIPGVATN